MNLTSKEYTNIMVRLGKIDANGEQTNAHLAKLNGSVARHQEQIGILSTAVARIEGEDEGAEKERGNKILTTQNIIAAAAVLIAIFTWLLK